MKNRLQKVFNRLKLPKKQQIVVINDFAKLDKDDLDKLTSAIEITVNTVLGNKNGKNK